MVDFLGMLISALPFAVAAVMLTGLGWSGTRAGGASLATAVLGAVVWPELEASAVPGALLAGLGTSAPGSVRALRGVIALQPALGRRGCCCCVAASREIGARPCRARCRSCDRGGAILRVGYGIRGGRGHKRPYPARRRVHTLEGRRAGELGPVRRALGSARCREGDRGQHCREGLRDTLSFERIVEHPALPRLRCRSRRGRGRMGRRTPARRGVGSIGAGRRGGNAPDEPVPGP